MKRSTPSTLRASRHRPSSRAVLSLATLTLFLAVATPSQAAERPEVLLDVGVGPSANLFFGPVFNDQPVHWGLKLSLEAIANQAAIQRNLRRVPKQYRSRASKMKEVRLKPLWFLPDTLFISPPVNGTGMYGVNFAPIGFGVAAGETARVSLGANLAVTYAYLFSNRIPTTHFLRPGISVDLEFELAPVKSFAISTGWQSTFYIPQQLGSFGVGPIDQSIFHVGQAFLKLHFRTPYKGKF